MKPRVYLETSVISYLTARESSSLIGASRQLLTKRWWDRRGNYDLVISEVVIRECRVGDLDAVNRRLKVLTGLPLLSLDDNAVAIATGLVLNKILPEKALEDALHISVAAAHRADFLLSWNFRYIANPVIQAKVAAYLMQRGLNYRSSVRLKNCLEKTMNDEIIAELQATKEKLAAQFAYNLKDLVNDIRRTQAESVKSGRSIVDAKQSESVSPYQQTRFSRGVSQ